MVVVSAYTPLSSLMLSEISTRDRVVIVLVVSLVTSATGWIIRWECDAFDGVFEVTS